MIDGLTKERYENFVNETDEMETLLWKRGDEIIKEFEKNKINIGIRYCSHVNCGENFFSLEGSWNIGGPSDEYSRTMPIDILFSDEALRTYIEDEVRKMEEYEKRKRELKEKKKRIREERERREYERLKAKFESKE